MGDKTLHLIANTRSGKGFGAQLPEIGTRVCQEYNAKLITYEIPSPDELETQIDLAIEAASRDGGIVVAAGGDGTIRSVAQKAAGRPVKFGVVACGTFNFFARTHSIPEEPEQAFRVILTGETRPVRLGEVNGEIFLINASLGLYAKAIAEREKRTNKWGRARWVVIISTIFSLLSRHRLLQTELLTGDKQQSLRTPMIFIGNNALQLRDLAMGVARCMKEDLLAVVTMKPLSKLEILRVIFRGLFKTIEKEERLETFCVDSLTIHTRRPQITVALDGELFQMRSPLKVRSRPGVLDMVLPRRE